MGASADPTRAPAPGYRQLQMIPMPQSDTFKVSNHLRAWFDIELRVRLQLMPMSTHRPGRSPRQRGAGHHPRQADDRPQGRRRKAGVPRTGRARSCAFETPVLAAWPRAIWEYRYVLRLAKSNPSNPKSPTTGDTMGRWQIRKVAGKKTLQVWDESSRRSSLRAHRIGLCGQSVRGHAAHCRGRVRTA